MLFYTKLKDDVLQFVQSSENGLSTKEASARLEKQGPNEIKKEKRPNYFLKFFAQFKDIMTIILIVAAIISVVFAIIKNSSSELIDAVIIFAIVLINATIGFVQEIKAQNAIDALKKMAQPFAKVLRDGKEQNIKSTELVAGDIVLLEAGDIIPADLYLLESHSLKCDESSLTGESLPVNKKANVGLAEKTNLAERKNMCYSSTVISYGRGKGVVVATGENSEIGKIASLLKEEKKTSTPLQESLNKLGEIITFIVLAIAIIIFLVDVLFAHHSYIESFLTAVAIAVAAIPESLPAVVTIILSIGVVKLSKKNAIIKNLQAVETLGCCQIICSDKTGTITKNSMTVREIVCGNRDQSTTPMIDDSNMLINCMNCCNDAHKGDNNYIGDPTEIALTKFIDEHQLRPIKYERVNEKPFDSVRKLMSTVNKIGTSYIQFTKGAIDEILARCKYIDNNGVILELTNEDKEVIRNQNQKFCSKSLRCLGFAMKKLDAKTSEISEKDLVYLGMVGMIDPPREEVFPAIQKCKSAGIRTVMITGDHHDTACAIAKELGIITNNNQAINGKELDKYTDKELREIINKYNVFTRVSPEHKVRIVKALRANGKIVAMTGDGVNDAPSIKSANIGVGMGKTGTEVTKNVADIILADDNFATIIVAVEEGRKIFSNIQNTIKFLLSCNIAEVLTIFAITLLFPQYTFLSAVQILFINLVTDTFPSIALGVDQTSENIMHEPPRSPNKNIIGGRVGIDIICQGLAQTLLVIGVYLIGILGFNSQQIATTMSFLTINFIQLFHMFNVRSNKSIFKTNNFKNQLLNIAFCVEIFVLILLVIIPPIANIFGLSALNFSQWLITFIFSIAIIPACELIKMLMNNHYSNLK